MIYQRPLAYPLGLEGVALLRAFAAITTANSVKRYSGTSATITWHFQLADR